MRALLIFANPNQAVPVSPYGLDIIRANMAVQEPAAEIRIINPYIESTDPVRHLSKVLAEFSPDIVGLSIRNIDNSVVAISENYPADGSPIDLVSYVPAIRELCDALREWNPEVPCVAGGAAFTSCPGEFLDYLGLDFGLLGAGEDSFRKLIVTLRGLRPPYVPHLARVLSTLPGAVYRADGPAFRTVPRAMTLCAEPNVTPEIASEYQLIYQLRGIPAAVRTKTGCPLRCAYCIDPVNMRVTDKRPVEHVLDDIDYYAGEYGLSSFHIADAELNLPYEDHVLALCAGMRRRGLADRVSWRGYFNAVPCSDQLLDALVSAGCRAPSFAIDSFVPAGLRGHQKNFRAAQAHDLLARLLERKARPEVCLLLGQPGETAESLQANIGWMLHYADQGVQVAYSCGIRVYPNTPLYRQRLNQDYLYTRPGPADSPLDPRAYCEPFPPRELAAYVRERTHRHENIQLFVEPLPEATHAEALRFFNVGIHRLAHGLYAESKAYLEAALSAAPDLAVARRALRLAGPILS